MFNIFLLKVKKHRLPILLLIILLLHLPFLSADPDIQLSFSRDAHTDEGLNTSQLRNYVNHGELNLRECDNMIKSPAFNLYLFTPLKLFGTRLPVARLSILLLCVGLFLLLFRNKAFDNVLWLFMLIGLTQYHLFNYMHYSLAEMPAGFCILLAQSCFFLFVWKNEKKARYIIAATGFTFLASCFKIQFAYMLAFVPAILALCFLILLIQKDNQKWEYLKYLGLSIITVFTGILGYYLIWYLPNKADFNFLMGEVASSRFATNQTWIHFKENVTAYTSSSQSSVLIYTFLFCLIPALYFIITQKFSKHTWLILASLVWVLLESHKLLILYVPSRYMLSFFFSMAWFIAVVCAFGLENRKTHIKLQRVFAYLTLLGIITLGTTNLITYAQQYHRREFHIKQANEFLSALSSEGAVMGPWAPTLTWGTKLRSYPVWKDFLNDKNIEATFHPVIIVSEPNEGCSGGAFKNDGIELGVDFPKVSEAKIGRWTIEIFTKKAEK